jgi:hypothetical protein
MMVLVFCARRKWDAAIQLYNSCLTLSPHDSGTLAALAFTWHLKGDLDQAVHYYHMVCLFVCLGDLYSAGRAQRCGAFGRLFVATLQAVGAAPDDTFSQQMLRQALASLVDVDLNVLLAQGAGVTVHVCVFLSLPCRCSSACPRRLRRPAMVTRQRQCRTRVPWTVLRHSGMQWITTHRSPALARVLAPLATPVCLHRPDCNVGAILRVLLRQLACLDGHLWA